MISYYEGTIFNTTSKTIVNTVNCSGFMGAGIALEFKLRFPNMYDDYKSRCDNKEVRTGKPYIYEESDDIWIMNFPTKAHWKFPSNIKWIKEGLKYFTDNYGKREIKSIAFPKLGCSNGGLKWDQVKPLMEEYLSELNIEVYICLDEREDAEGIEKCMVEGLNNIIESECTCNIGLVSKQAKMLVDNIPIKRFRDVENIDGLGEKSYSKLFTYFYKRALTKNGQKEFINDNNIDDREGIQLSLDI